MLAKLPRRSGYWQNNEMDIIYEVVKQCSYGAYGLINSDTPLKIILKRGDNFSLLYLYPFYSKNENEGLCNHLSYYCYNRLKKLMKKSMAEFKIIKGKEYSYFWGGIDHYFLSGVKKNLKEEDMKRSLIIIDPSLKRVVFWYDDRKKNYFDFREVKELKMKKSSSALIYLPSDVMGVNVPLYYEANHGVLVLLQTKLTSAGLLLRVLIRDRNRCEWSFDPLDFYKVVKDTAFAYDEHMVKLAENLKNAEIIYDG